MAKKRKKPREKPVEKRTQKDETVARLNLLYKKAVGLKRVKDALAIQLAVNEINLDGGDEAAALQTIRSHLAPLKLAPPETPIIELVRLAVQKIVEASGGDGRLVDGELEIVRSHLAPLNLAAAGVSTGELARLAVQKIVELTSARPEGKS